MILTSAATVVATIAALAATTTDTTMAVHPGTRLEVHNFGGEIEIIVWDRNAVRIAADYSGASRVAIQRTGDVIEINSRGRRGIPPSVEYKILVPKWMPLDLTGVNTDMVVRGTRADVSAETVNGDVTVDGGSGIVKLSSVQGSVTVGGAKGRVELSSLNNEVSVFDVDGDIWVDAVNGDVKLERVHARSIEASTVNGDVAFVGPVLEGGRYRLASHHGDLLLALPDQSDAKVSVATFSGEVEANFPVHTGRTGHGRRYAFTLGNGSALVDLETFAGTVRLYREMEDLERVLKQSERLIKRQKERMIHKVRVPRTPRAPRAPHDETDHDEEEDRE